jgi:hypothetical protein
MGINPACRAKWRRRFPPWLTGAEAGRTDPDGIPLTPRWLADQGGRLTGAIEPPTVAHGRREQRICWAITHPGILDWIGCTGTHQTRWPHVHQLCRIERRRTPVSQGRPPGPTSVEVTYFITSLTPDRADAATLLRIQRGHWQIENGLHYVRDVTFGEDHSTVRSGAAPQSLAACRNLAIALLRRSGLASIAAGLRTFAGRPHSAIRHIASAGLPR